MRKTRRVILKPPSRLLMYHCGHTKPVRVLLKKGLDYIPMRIWPPRLGKIMFSAHLSKCGKNRLLMRLRKLGINEQQTSLRMKGRRKQRWMNSVKGMK